MFPLFDKIKRREQESVSNNDFDVNNDRMCAPIVVEHQAIANTDFDVNSDCMDAPIVVSQQVMANDCMDAPDVVSQQAMANDDFDVNNDLDEDLEAWQQHTGMYEHVCKATDKRQLFEFPSPSKIQRHGKVSRRQKVAKPYCSELEECFFFGC